MIVCVRSGPSGVSSPDDRDLHRFNPQSKHALAGGDQVTRFEPHSLGSAIVDEGAVGTAEIAQLTLRRIDLDHEVVARQGHVFGHGTMHKARPADDERVMPFKDE